LGATLSRPIGDLEVLPIHVSEIMQTLQECLNALRVDGGRRCSEESHQRHLVLLLRCGNINRCEQEARQQPRESFLGQLFVSRSQSALRNLITARLPVKTSA